MKTEMGLTFLILVLILSACSPTNGAPAEPRDLSKGDTTEPEEPLIEGATELSPTEADQDPTLSMPTVQSELPPAGAGAEFSTDFSIHLIPYDEIRSGGPSKDVIPAIDDPKFIGVTDADSWNEDIEPVVQVSINGETKAYPIKVLIWHEIVNDDIGGIPVVVTFCPLCNTAIAFERQIDGQLLDFGTTGRLRYSNLLMYDRQTESWWQQATGEAIVGALTGAQLEYIPAAMISWADFKQTHPDGLVLSKETGHNRDYGQNPYVGYDDVDRPPFLYDGPETPDVLAPVARVLALEINQKSVVYPFEVLEEVQVVNDSINGLDVVIFWTPGTASALDTRQISAGQDVGAAMSYDRHLEGETLTFRAGEEGQFVDQQTGSIWDIQGNAVDGPLEGESLKEVVSVNVFWFTWAVFKSDTQVYAP